MRHRFTRVLLAAVLVMLLAGTATVARQAEPSRGRVVQRRLHLSAHGSARRLRGRGHSRASSTASSTRPTARTRSTARRSTSPTSTSKGDPATGVSAAKDLIGQGYKIIMGDRLVGRRAPGSAARGAEPGSLHLGACRGGRDHRASTSTRSAPAGRPTRTCSTPHSFLAGVAARRSSSSTRTRCSARATSRRSRPCIGGKGHTVSEVSVPLTATDFTPFAQQAKQANPDLLFVAWAGTTAGAMWKALDQQGAFSGTKVVTGLAESATWSTLGDRATKIQFLSHYVYTAPKNKVNDWLVRQMRKRSQAPGHLHAGRLRRRRR